MIFDRNIDDAAAIQPHKILGAGALLRRNAHAYYVDYIYGSDNNSGRSPSRAKQTIQAAVTAAGAWDTVYVFRRTSEATGTDPYNYAETIIIPRANEGMSLIGVGAGRTQGGWPQIRKGSGSTALLTVRAPGCLIANLGFNASSSTGGGILLDDDAGATKTAFGTVIQNCHFKNCVGSTATNSATGGAIQWSTNGQANQVLIRGNRFYKNVGDIVLLGTSNAVPQDVVIEDNIFSGPAANVDCNLYLAGGTGMNGVIIKGNYFTAKPALSSGVNNKFMVLTGCVGLLANNYFATLTCEGGSQLTFGAASGCTGAVVPTTVFMAGNYGEVITGTGAGLETGEVFRT